MLANGPQGSGLWLLAADGGSATLLDPQGREPHWAAGGQLVFGVPNGVRLYDVAGNTTYRIDLPAGSWAVGVTSPEALQSLPIYFLVVETPVAFIMAERDVAIRRGPNAEL